jgi:casein kinase 1
VGKKIGEGSFGVIFEGTNLLNNQQVAIKFVSIETTRAFALVLDWRC